jgi:hypothetical protein
MKMKDEKITFGFHPSSFTPGGMLTIKGLQKIVELTMSVFERLRIIKEAFRRNSEELGSVSESIRVE